MIDTEPPEQSDKSELEGKNLLESFIQHGLKLIKEGHYEEAMSYFENRQMAETQGYHYELSPLEAVVRKPISLDGEIKKVVDFCATNSYFDDGLRGSSDKPQIALSTVYIPENILNSIKPEVIARLNHNVALIHAEEWIHGLQRKKGPLAGSTDSDIDVAVYLFNEGVPQTEEFLARNGRAEAISKIRASQSLR